MNNLTIMGNLTRDVNLRTVNVAGVETKVADFTVAANSGYGERRRTTYVRVTAWRGLAESCAKYLSKGKKVFVDGEATVQLYQGNDKQYHAVLCMTAKDLEFAFPREQQTAPAEELEIPEIEDAEEMPELPF